MHARSVPSPRPFCLACTWAVALQFSTLICMVCHTVRFIGSPDTLQLRWGGDRWTLERHQLVSGATKSMQRFLRYSPLLQCAGTPPKTAKLPRQWNLYGAALQRTCGLALMAYRTARIRAKSKPVTINLCFGRKCEAYYMITKNFFILRVCSEFRIIHVSLNSGSSDLTILLSRLLKN